MPIALKLVRINDEHENEAVSTSGEDTTEFSLEPYASKKKAISLSALKPTTICYNMLLGVEQNVTVTNIDLKVIAL